MSNASAGGEAAATDRLAGEVRLVDDAHDEHVREFRRRTIRHVAVRHYTSPLGEYHCATSNMISFRRKKGSVQGGL